MRRTQGAAQDPAAPSNFHECVQHVPGLSASGIVVITTGGRSSNQLEYVCRRTMQFARLTHAYGASLRLVTGPRVT
jgi:hypothetical protein